MAEDGLTMVGDKTLRISFKRGRRFFNIVPKEMPFYQSSQIVLLRQKLQLTQPEFATVLGVKRHTLKEYESGRLDPRQPVQHLLYLIEQDNSLIHQFLTITANEKYEALQKKALKEAQKEALKQAQLEE